MLICCSKVDLDSRKKSSFKPWVAKNQLCIQCVKRNSRVDSNLFCLICCSLQHLDFSHTFVPTSQDRAPGIFLQLTCLFVLQCSFAHFYSGRMIGDITILQRSHQHHILEILQTFTKQTKSYPCNRTFHRHGLICI